MTEPNETRVTMGHNPYKKTEVRMTEEVYCTPADIEQALIEERKRIGEWLESQNWNPDYHGAYIIPRIVMKLLIMNLKEGKSPERVKP